MQFLFENNVPPKNDGDISRRDVIKEKKEVKLNCKCKKGTKNPDTNECNDGDQVSVGKFLGSCDRVRRKEIGCGLFERDQTGEDFWQEMMKTKKEISEKEFKKHVNIKDVLEDGETWTSYKKDAMTEGEPLRFYASENGAYFFQHAGFEYIWKEENNKINGYNKIDFNESETTKNIEEQKQNSNDCHDPDTGKFCEGFASNLLKSKDGIKALEKIVEDFQISYQHDDAIDGDFALKKIAEIQGFDNNPKIMYNDEFDNYTKENESIILYRGVSGKKFSDEFKHGSYWAGKGLTGCGTYTAYGPRGLQMASQYVEFGVGKLRMSMEQFEDIKNKQHNTDGVVMRMCLPKDAKIINYDDITKVLTRNLLNVKNSKVRDLLFDEGRFAAALGYDAINMGSNVMIVLNRSKIIVAENDIKQKQNSNDCHDGDASSSGFDSRLTTLKTKYLKHNESVKLNYKCKKENSPDGMSNKCPDDEEVSDAHKLTSKIEKNKMSTSNFKEVQSDYNPELGGFYTTDYKSYDSSLRVISQDKEDDKKLLDAISDIDSTKLPSQFMIMKMIDEVPVKYYSKTKSIGVSKKLSSDEMKIEIEKVLNKMKQNSIEYVVPSSDNIKENRRGRCKRGTVDDTFKCADNKEESSDEMINKSTSINDLLNEHKSSKNLISKIVDSSESLEKTDRPIIHLGDLDGMSEGMKSFKKFDTWRGTKDYKLELFKDDDGGIVASVAGQEVGYIKMLNDNSIDLTVAEEMQFNGIGTLMSVEFFKEHPNAMFKTGGLTPSGKRSISKVVKQLYNEKLLSEKVTPTKDKKIDFKNSETTNKFVDIYKNDKNIFNNAEDQAIMSYAHERSADLPPKVVSTRSFNEYVKNGATELFRGTTKEYANKFESDPNFYMGSGIHGSGVYTAYGNMGRDVAKHYAGNSDDALIIRLALSKDAKTIGVQEIEDMMNEEMKELNKDTVRYEDLERSTGKDREKLQEKYEEDAAKRNLMYDPGRFALIKGYDAINIPDLEFMIVLNRSKVIVEKVRK